MASEVFPRQWLCWESSTGVMCDSYAEALRLSRDFEIEEALAEHQNAVGSPRGSLALSLFEYNTERCIEATQKLLCALNDIHRRMPMDGQEEILSPGPQEETNE